MEEPTYTSAEGARTDAPDVAIEFQPISESALALLTDSFPDEEVLESNAFTGAELLILILAATRGTLNKVLDFFIQNRQSFKDATVKIGKDEISLQGYSMNDIQDFFKLEAVQQLLKERPTE